LFALYFDTAMLTNMFLALYCSIVG